MFGGLLGKTARRLDDLEKRLDHNSGIIEEDHHDLVDLKLKVRSLEKINQGLIRKHQEQTRRLNLLREALSEAINKNG